MVLFPYGLRSDVPLLIDVGVADTRFDEKLEMVMKLKMSVDKKKTRKIRFIIRTFPKSVLLFIFPEGLL